ncbi:MAG: hypothetical protein GEV28_36730 [Actinophytocola sp.]|uniref:SH3 domain-containing protein n=1 Tax=Actinophytocola sp. TaxID=1872138 RepID=UPI00132B9CD2|nr:SH3 domain-containing protein [Actinophytocola sp.]MPZ85631.1 hypothetical protein [Actinophytocola sp.]
MRRFATSVLAVLILSAALLGGLAATAAGATASADPVATNTYCSKGYPHRVVVDPGSSLYIRTQPSAGAPTVGSLLNGTLIVTTGRTPTNGYLYTTTYGPGYVAAAYLTFLHCA